MNWIKLNASLFASPKVSTITALLLAATSNVTSNVTGNVTHRDSVIVAILRVWMAANEYVSSDSGDTIRYATLATLDEWGGISGLGAAMASVGWAIEGDGILILPGFVDHNTPVKGRQTKTNAERQKAYRERQKMSQEAKNVTNVVTNVVTEDVTNVVTCDAREEKRREDNKEPLPSPRRGEMPTLQRVQQFAETVMIGPDEAEAYWLAREASDWTRSSNGSTMPVGNWQADLRSYTTAARNRATESRRRSGPPPRHNDPQKPLLPP